MSATPHRLIGLGGKLRSGKDAAADYLVEHHGYVKFGMSDALNDFLVAQNPIVGIQGYEQSPDVVGMRFKPIFLRYAEHLEKHGYVEAKATLEEFREIMQRTGTEAGREVLYENVWVDAVKRKILASTKPVVVTGIRFPNELQMIRDLGGESVWIHRPAESPSKASTPLDEAMTRHPAGKALRSAPAASQHASETSVHPDDFKWYVNNASSLESLYEHIRVIAVGR